MESRSKIPNLPDDIVNSILLELPVKSLLRFKITCKSWRCFIDDPWFLKLHQHKSSTDISRQKFLLFDAIDKVKIPPDYSIKVLSTEASISADSKIVSLDEPNILRTCSTQHHHHLLQVHSCDGLVFIYHPGNMMLWNPVIQRYKQIPVPDTLQNRSSFRSIQFGFAYDYVAEDYKVLCIQMISICPRYIVEIYSVKNQSWRTIDNFPIPPNFLLYSAAVSVKGAVHINAYSFVEGNVNKCELLVISLYLADEKFIVTPVPTNFGNSREFHAFADHACVFGSDNKEMSIWSLDKDGKTGLLTWNHIMKIPTLGSVLPNFECKGHFICVKENGNIVWKKRNGPFIEYDARKNEFTEFMLEKIPAYRDLLLYVESLVSFKIQWD